MGSLVFVVRNSTNIVTRRAQLHKNPTNIMRFTDFLPDAFDGFSENVHQGRASMAPWFSTTRGLEPRFANLGNTCYMNSSLQCLLQCRRFVHEVIMAARQHQRVVPHHQNFCALHQLNALIQEYQKGDVQIIYPYNFVAGLQHVSGSLIRGQQQDASEFIFLLMAKLDDIQSNGCHDQRRMNGYAPNQIWTGRTIADVCFNGITTSKSICASCGHSSTERTTFRQLSVPITDRNNVVESLNEMFLPECLEEREQRQCGNCNDVVRHLVDTSISHAPQILNIRINRFQENGKNNQFVSFPLLVDMAAFTTRCNERCEYHLVGIVEHRGKSHNCGHYVAAIRGEGDRWYLMNDDKKIELGRERVLETNPYILFYEKS